MGEKLSGAYQLHLRYKHSHPSSQPPPPNLVAVCLITEGFRTSEVRQAVKCSDKIVPQFILGAFLSFIKRNAGSAPRVPAALLSGPGPRYWRSYDMITGSYMKCAFQSPRSNVRTLGPRGEHYDRGSGLTSLLG
jgi:hypothetical protein